MFMKPSKWARPLIITLLVSLFSIGGRADNSPIDFDPFGAIASGIRVFNFDTLPNQTDFGQLNERFMIFVMGAPLWSNRHNPDGGHTDRSHAIDKKIEKMVGAPGTLEPGTSAKIGTFGPAMRLKIYSILLNNMRSVESKDRLSSQPVADLNAHNSNSAVISLSREETDRFTDEFISRASGYFRAAELFDLGVYIIWHLAGLPDDSNWEIIKRKISKSDVLLAVAGALAISEVNEGRITASGWLVASKDGSYRFGWYAKLSELGFELRPHVSAGLNLGSKRLTSSAGVVKHINPQEGQPKTSLELSIRKHLVSAFADPLGWDYAFSLRSRYALDHTDPSKSGNVATTVDFFGGKKVNVRKRSMQLVIDGAGAVDFDAKYAAHFVVGLDDEAAGISGMIRVGGNKAPKSDLDLNIGLMLGGSTEGAASPHRRLMQGGSMLREAIEYYQKLEDRYCSVGEQLNQFGTGSLIQEEETELVNALKLVSRHLRIAATEFNEKLHFYLLARKDYYKKLDSDEKGPLNGSELDYARARLLGAIPEAELVVNCNNF